MPVAKIVNPLRGVASLFYPALCAICREAITPEKYLCRACLERAPRITAPFCAKCSEPFTGAIDREFTCANCAHRGLHFDAAVSAYRSRGVVRFVILRLKYGRELPLRRAICHWLMEALQDTRLRERTFDIITPVPLHPARLRERGFNQAELLARELSRQINLPLAEVLQRVRYTTTQTALERSDRMENLRNAFRLRKNADVRGLHVLLVDDILTTGSTLSECARILRKKGASSVYAVTAARA